MAKNLASNLVKILDWSQSCPQTPDTGKSGVLLRIALDRQ